VPPRPPKTKKKRANDLDLNGDTILTDSMPAMKTHLATLLCIAITSLSQAEPPAMLGTMPLIFSEDFDKGFDRWEVLDPQTWTHRVIDGNAVFGINQRESSYKPPYRSPFHIALIKDVSVADFVLSFRVRSTKDTGNHRDCCIIFNHQDAANFYYAHLGAKPDPNSGQIMIVKNAPRTPITRNTKNVPWTDGWHQVKVVRDSTKGSIEVFFDDMTTPQLSANDKTFGKGRIGIGSFDDMDDFDDVRLHGK
jgi:hypothetical protein